MIYPTALRTRNWESRDFIQGRSTVADFLTTVPKLHLLERPPIPDIVRRGRNVFTEVPRVDPP